jgi:uncharacterized protein with HEPN domain
MRRKFKLYLSDIIEQIDKIKVFTKGLTFEDFKNDEKTIYAVTRALEIIGEAANYIPEEIKIKYKNIPWLEIRKFRNVIVHKYWGVEIDVEWDIIEKKLDELKMYIEKVMSELEL